MRKILLLLFFISTIAMGKGPNECTQENTTLIEIAAPGLEILSAAAKRINCDINLLYLYPTRIKTIDMGSRDLDYETIFTLLNMSSTGAKLMQFFESKIANKELKIQEMPKSMIDEFYKNRQGSQGQLKMAYVHSKRTLYYNLDFIGLNNAHILLGMVHELTHAKDLWNTKNVELSVAQELDLEVSAFKTEDIFFEELLIMAPCLKTVFPNYPMKLTRNEIANLYNLN